MDLNWLAWDILYRELMSKLRVCPGFNVPINPDRLLSGMSVTLFSNVAAIIGLLIVSLIIFVILPSRWYLWSVELRESVTLFILRVGEILCVALINILTVELSEANICTANEEIKKKHNEDRCYSNQMIWTSWKSHTSVVTYLAVNKFYYYGHLSC